MTRYLALIGLLASTTALATGERVQLVPGNSPFKDTLCVSMDCQAASPEVTVATRSVRDGLEVTVTMSSGQRRLTEVIPTKPDGTVSSTDLVKASSDVLKAIEVGPSKTEQVAEGKAKVKGADASKKGGKAIAKKPAKKLKGKLWAQF